MARVGIGDTELARRLQVSRLTLVRWKEGVTNRPRHREDVVRCCEVLRLTPAECDGLLVAAGFEPEGASPEPERTSPQPARPSRPLARRRGILLATTALLVVGAMVGVLYLTGLLGRSPDHPVAALDESLIVMGTFSNYTGGQQGFNIQGRLMEEIESEFEAAGLPNVRTVEWPALIATESDAVDAGIRSRASMVIWGEYDSGRVIVTFTVPPLPRVQGSHQPQVVNITASPDELPTTVNFALADEVNSVALMTLGQIYLDKGEHDLAKTTLARALNRQSIDRTTLAGLRFQLGRAYLGGKYADPDEAVWLFTQVLAVQPRSVATLNNRALAYLDRGRDGDAALALDDLTRAVGLVPRRAEIYLNRAVAHLEHGGETYLGRALADLERAIEIDPDYASAYVNRAGVYLQRGDDGDLEQAFDDIEKALSIDPEQEVAYVNLGNAYLQRGDPGDLMRAAAEFSRAIELEPDSAAAYYNRGLVRSALWATEEDWAQSTDDFRRAQELRSRDFTFNSTLCWQLGLQRLGDQALPFCEIALWEQPEGLARDSRGLVLAVMGREREAVAEFEAFIGWVESSPKESCGRNYLPSRSAWVEELRTGGNPFDDETLQGLRVRPAAPSAPLPC